VGLYRATARDRTGRRRQRHEHQRRPVRIRQTVDPDAEWRKCYDETGRIMRDNFSERDLRGIDWTGVLDPSPIPRPRRHPRELVTSLGGCSELGTSSRA